MMLSMTKRPRQLQLELKRQPRWGGSRPGSGRKPGPIRRDPHRRRPTLAARHPCVTLKVRRDVPSLRSVRLVRQLERSFRAARERGRFRLVHYSIQGNHLHMIVEATSSWDLASGMKSIGARVARAVNRVFEHRGPVLADRFHARILRTPREVRNALAYVLLNARRHLFKAGRPVPRTGRMDPASSARWFDGWRVALRREHDPPAVARARTWLLLIGWRKMGLIDVSEVPGS